MATYVLGDIQGCFEPLQRLLKQLNFNAEQDHLWFAGDLVSRGRYSLETLRFIKALSEQQAAITVLGNHDISLIAAAYGITEPHKSLLPVLEAPDAKELIEWLRQRPLIHYCEQQQAVLVHAGIPPVWTLQQALEHSRMIEAELQQADPRKWLKSIYGNKPASWKNCRSKIDKQRYTVNALTRIRYCHSDGKLDFQHKLSPDVVKIIQPKLVPWFRHPDRKPIAATIFFGHWSTLGYRRENKVISLDTGCVWGGNLTAIELGTDHRLAYQLACDDYQVRKK